MIGLLLGGILRPFMGIFTGLMAALAIFGCVKCAHCRIRDCACLKRLFRFVGHDEFDDFELMVLIHEAMFECTTSKKPTVVRITAGPHIVETDPNSNGIFQQPLNITVEQGVGQIVIDLMDTHKRVLGTLSLNTMEKILKPRVLRPEIVLPMKQSGKGIRNPKIKFTMVVSSGSDAEMGHQHSHGMSSDVDILVRQQLQKAKVAKGIESDEGLGDMEVLQQACTGPLEQFKGLGKTDEVYVAILGPPTSRRYVLGVWDSKHDFEKKKTPLEEIDLLKIQSVQADPSRHHVFVVSYFDESRVHKMVNFRRVDRNRDVWVEILYLLVTKARDNIQKLKRDKTLIAAKNSAARGSGKTKKKH